MNELNFYESSFQRHKAQALIDSLRERESKKTPVRVDSRTIVYVPMGVDKDKFIEKWKRKTEISHNK